MAGVKSKGMYDSYREHDACGLGFLVNMNNEKSHSVITSGVTILKNLLHRGATSADQKNGDGAGLQFQLPDRFFRKIYEEKDLKLPVSGNYGVGMFFLPTDEILKTKCCE